MKPYVRKICRKLCTGLLFVTFVNVVLSSNSAETEFGLPITELFITNNTLNGSLRLITNVSDTEVVFSEDLILNDKFYNQIVIFCNASYPVEWIYEGDGAPRLHTGQFRTYQVFNNSATYEYSAVIALYQERYNEQQTGTYVCRSVEDEKLRVFYHLYFPGDFGFPAIRNQVIRTGKNATFVTLPCKATDPNGRMSLLKIFPPKEQLNLTDSRSVTYDPREGFQLNLNEIKNPYGSYVCEARGEPSFWKMDLVPPKDEEVIIYPRKIRVSLSAFQNQTFTCRAKEPITIVTPTSYDIGRLDLNTNLTFKYPYKATFKLKSSIPLTTIGHYFKINCVTKRDFRVLHSWHYSNIENERITVSFDKNQRRILCCNNLDLSPTYEFAPCETLTDCQITESCFKGSHCRPAIFPAPRIVDAPKGCIAAQFPDTINTHVMRCSVGGKHEVHYITESLEPEQIIIYNGQIPQTEKILKVKLLPTTNRDNQTRIQCTGKAFFFSLNFVFALEKYDGSMEIVDGEFVELAQTYTPILSLVIDRSVRRVVCFAPLTRSSEWVNASLSTSVQDFTTTTASTTTITATTEVTTTVKPAEIQAQGSTHRKKFQRKSWRPNS
ncbi:unnamed protein product, partial [Allacma fusca]